MLHRSISIFSILIVFMQHGRFHLRRPRFGVASPTRIVPSTRKMSPSGGTSTSTTRSARSDKSAKLVCRQSGRRLRQGRYILSISPPLRGIVVGLHWVAQRSPEAWARQSPRFVPNDLPIECSPGAFSHVLIATFRFSVANFMRQSGHHTSEFSQSAEPAY